ncbi:MAG: hypothetical protein ACK4Y5_20790 [Acetobacteraceae bacterium]|jgi:hypothetical protein
MSPSLSYLETVLERAWSIINRSTSEGELTDDYVIRHFILPAQEEVVSRCTGISTLNYVGSLQFTTTAGQASFVLPPIIATVLRLVELDTSGNEYIDWMPRSLTAPSGPGWRLSANTLVFDPPLTDAKTFVLRFVPSGDFVPHYAHHSHGCTVAADGKTVTMGTPQLGYVDRRPNSLVGQMFRMIPTSGLIQERLIVVHDAAASTITLGDALSGTFNGVTKYAYEVAPPISQAFLQAVAYRAAIGMGTRARMPEGQLELIRRSYADAVKTLRDRAQGAQGRTPPRFDRNTVDNPDVRMATGVAWRL